MGCTDPSRPAVGRPGSCAIALAALLATAAAPSVARAFDVIQSHSEAPWQASIWSDEWDGHFCGAALVAPDWAMTTASCFRDAQNDPQWDDLNALALVLGTTDVTTGGERVGIGEVIVHPAYDPGNHESDIALLRLDHDFGTGSVVRLPESGSSVAPDTVLQIAGWGHTDFGDSEDVGRVMKRISLPVVARDACNAPDRYAGAVTDSMLCAGHLGGGEDACVGFSGSAAMDRSDGADIAIGLVSWGHGCGTPGKVGVYTRISAFADWIDATIGGQ